MKVDVYRLFDRPPHEQQRMLAALRFADLAAFRDACSYVCGQLSLRYYPSNLQGNKRASWNAFIRREFARDVEMVPEAAAALFFIHLWNAHNRREHTKRVAAAAKARETLKAQGGKPFWPKRWYGQGRQ